MKKNKNGISNYLKKHKCAIFFYLLFLLIGSIGSALLTIVFAKCVTEVTYGNLMGCLNLLVLALIIQIATMMGYWVSNTIYFKYANIIWREISIDLTKRCFMLSSSSFSENNTGSFTQRILNDPENMIDQLAGLIGNITALLSGAIVVGYIITLNWIIGLCYITILVVMFVLEVRRQKVWKNNMLNMKKASDSSYSLINEIVKSEKDIKSLDLEDELYESATKNLKINEKSHTKANTTDWNFRSFRSLILAIFSISILILGVILMKKELFTISIFLIIFTYKDELDAVIWCFGETYKAFTDISVSAIRMFSLYDENIYSTDKFGNVSIEQVEGKIEFKNVAYSYSNVEEVKEKTKKNKEKIKMVHTKGEKIFKNLSFDIKANTTVAFVGKSGSGKTTIAALISKLIDADEGEVLIDGENIKNLTKETIRKNISMINQFPYIFDMSIKDNLLLAKKDATDEELWTALKQACFDEDVKALPKGIDSKVGESGIKLSGGQRQRLAIARALLKNSKIIIFDESTSSLDNFAQSHIQQSIENLKGQHTVIIIAHRLSTIKNVDTLYFLKEGEIIGQGNFDELFKNNQEFQDMFMIENI